MFKPQFAPLVKAGTKRQTIRPVPKRMPQPGDCESWRQWSGKPYRSPQVELAKVIITTVERIHICEAGICIGMWAAPYDTVAEADGFKDFAEMREWFKAQHGLPFDGILIRAI